MIVRNSKGSVGMCDVYPESPLRSRLFRVYTIELEWYLLKNTGEAGCVGHATHAQYTPAP